MSRFEEILDRQLETERSGEMTRQAHGEHHEKGKRSRKGYSSSPRKVRRRVQSRMAR